MPDTLVIPYIIADTLTAEMLRHLPSTLHSATFEALKRRQFDHLWTNPEVLDFLRTHCLCCGLELNLSDMTSHMQKRHHTGQYIPQSFIALLTLHLAQMIDATQCKLCGNPVDVSDDTWSQTHLTKCPIVLQVAALFTEPVGLILRNGSFSGGHPRSIVGSLPKHGASVSNKGSPSQQETKKATSNRSRSRRSNAGPNAANGPLSPSSRSRSSSLTSSMLLRTVLQRPKRKCPAEPGDGGPEVAATSEAEVSAVLSQVSTTEVHTPADATKSDSIADGGSEHEVLRPISRAMDPKCELTGDHVGRKFPISTMERPCSKDGDTPQESFHTNAEDVGNASTTGATDGHRSGHRAEISLHEDSPKHIGSDSMDARGQPSSGRLLPDVASSDSQQRLATDLLSHETALHATIKAGGSLAETDAEIIIRDFSLDELHYLNVMVGVESIITMKLTNDTSSSDYATSTVRCICWCHLLVRNSTTLIWGSRTTEFFRLFFRGLGPSIDLRALNGFESLFHTWQSSIDNPNAVSEFFKHLLSWMHTPVFDHTWERRAEGGSEHSGTRVDAKGDAFAPIVISSDLFLSSPLPIPLSHIIDKWHRSNEMITALCTAPDALCFQVSASPSSITPTSGSLDLSPETCIRAFLQDDIQTHSILYTPVALIAQAGTSDQGTFCTMLKAWDRKVPGRSCWIKCDGLTSPTAYEELPEDFLCRLTHVCVLKTSIIDMQGILAIPPLTEYPATLKDDMDEALPALTTTPGDETPHAISTMPSDADIIANEFSTDDLHSYIGLVGAETFLSMTLKNDDASQCYINSAFTCTCWCLLLLDSDTLGTWGNRTAEFFHFFFSGVKQTIKLRALKCFNSLFAHWQPQSGSQEDVSEFFMHMLSWMQSPVFNHHWERRYVTDSGNNDILTVDSGSTNAPIVLKSDLFPSSRLPMSLGNILFSWHRTASMITAFCEAPDALCFQVSRFVSLTEQHREALDVTHDVSIQVFLQDGIMTRSILYTPVALIAYGVSAMHGHFNTMLKTWDKDVPGRTCWLYCDDNRIPTTYDEIPEWYMRKISHVCIMRKSKIDMRGISKIPPVAADIGARPSGISPTSQAASEQETLRTLMASIAARNR